MRKPEFPWWEPNQEPQSHLREKGASGAFSWSAQGSWGPTGETQKGEPGGRRRRRRWLLIEEGRRHRGWQLWRCCDRRIGGVGVWGWSRARRRRPGRESPVEGHGVWPIEGLGLWLWSMEVGGGVGLRGIGLWPSDPRLVVPLGVGV